jgi:ADP-heptose:LPS heptosyltransferase
MTGGSIEEMAERMIACSAFIANDSGVMNVANALGIPLVALFAPTNVTTRGPLRETSVAVAVAKDCSPCEMHATEAETRFRSGGCACIDDISVDQVLEALGKISALPSG